MNNGLQVKSVQCKPNEQALVSENYSINHFWLTLKYRKKKDDFFRLKIIQGMPFHIFQGDNVWDYTIF